MADVDDWANCDGIVQGVVVANLDGTSNMNFWIVVPSVMADVSLTVMSRWTIGRGVWRQIESPTLQKQLLLLLLRGIRGSGYQKWRRQVAEPTGGTEVHASKKRETPTDGRGWKENGGEKASNLVVKSNVLLACLVNSRSCRSRTKGIKRKRDKMPWKCLHIWWISAMSMWSRRFNRPRIQG